MALCGVSAAPIHRLLEVQPQLEEVTLCLDHDEAGHSRRPPHRRVNCCGEWNVTVSAEFPSQKDWNDELLTNRPGGSPGTDHVHVILPDGAFPLTAIRLYSQVCK